MTHLGGQDLLQLGNLLGPSNGEARDDHNVVEALVQHGRCEEKRTEKERSISVRHTVRAVARLPPPPEKRTQGAQGAGRQWRCGSTRSAAPLAKRRQEGGRQSATRGWH